ncbi:MAG: acyl-CoA thioesterase [Flavobacteriales bacterium]
MTKPTILPYCPEIRFRDIDAMGHVNNAVFLSYFEQARIHFFRQLVGERWDWRSKGILVARNEINYRLPVHLHHRIEIHVGVEHIGNKSFTLNYEVRCEEHVCADALSVLVYYNHSEGHSMNLPEEWVARLNELLPS